MFSFRTVLLLFIFTLIAFVGSTNGQPACGSSSSSEELYDYEEQARQSSNHREKAKRLILDCETTGGSSISHTGSIVIGLSVGLFFLILVAIGIWIVFVRRQKAMNAAATIPDSGEVGAKEMGNGLDGTTNTVAMSTTTGKLSSGDTNV